LVLGHAIGRYRQNCYIIPVFTIFIEKIFGSY